MKVRSPHRQRLTSNRTYNYPRLASVTFDFISSKSTERNGFLLEYEAGALLYSIVLSAG